MEMIVITGGLGFIGSHTVIELLGAGYGVIVVDNLSNASLDVMDKIKAIVNMEEDKCKDFFHYYNMDIRDFDGLCSIFENNNVYGVIHFAALKSVAESIDNPLLYYDNNVFGTINLLKVMEKYGVKNLIFSSSATVYGNAEPPFKETDIIGNGITNPYGNSKYIIEEILKDLKDWSIYALRYFNPIGAHKSGLLGDNPNNIPTNIMPYIMRVACGQYPLFSIYGNDYDTNDKTAERDYIHVVDLAVAHVLALKNIQKGYHAVNIGNGIPVSVMELVTTFENVNNVSINKQFCSRRQGDVPKSYCDNTLLKKLFKWTPELSLNDMCLDSYNFIKHQE